MLFSCDFFDADRSFLMRTKFLTPVSVNGRAPAPLGPIPACEPAELLVKANHYSASSRWHLFACVDIPQAEALLTDTYFSWRINSM